MPERQQHVTAAQQRRLDLRVLGLPKDAPLTAILEAYNRLSEASYPGNRTGLSDAKGENGKAGMMQLARHTQD